MNYSNDNQPLVSIGIPTYNRPEGLRRTLQCVSQQTYRNIEIIISDNCSPNPKVSEVVQEFITKDSRIKYFKQQENYGASFNFKFVLDKSHGKYFMWAADDDASKSTYIENCVNILEEKPEVVLCYSEAIIEDFLGEKEYLWKSDMTTTDLPRLSGIKKILVNQHRNTEFYGLMRTQIVKQFELTKLVFGSDHTLILFMALHGNFAKTIPGLFISGVGNNGTPELVVKNAGLKKHQIYFGYISQLLHMLQTIWGFSQNTLLDKIRLSLYMIDRYKQAKFFNPIFNGIKQFIKNSLSQVLSKS